jgi:hypothetical protein
MNTNMSLSHAPVNESTRSSVHKSISNSDFSLPIFDEDLGVNPLFHIRQLDEFIQLSGGYCRLTSLQELESLSRGSYQNNGCKPFMTN